MPTKQAAKPATHETATPAPFDADTMTVNVKREPPKIRRLNVGIDRTPFYNLLKRLQPNQVVEIPRPLDDKQAKSAQNLIRESAKDLSLAVSFLVDVERDAAGSDQLSDGLHFYAWFVKGPYVPRPPKAQK